MRWNRLAGVIALMATIGTAAAAFQIRPEVVTQISTPATGLWIPAQSTGEIIRVDAGSGRVTARVRIGEPGAEFVIDEQDRGVVVVDRTAGRVVLVDPALHTVVRGVGTIPTGEAFVDIGPEVVVSAAGSRVDLVDLDVTTSTTATVSGTVRSIAAAGNGAAGLTNIDRFRIAGDGSVDSGGDLDGTFVRVLDRVVVASGDSVRDLKGSRLACFGGDIGNPSHVISTSDEWIVAVQDSLIHVADLTNGECAVVDLGPVGQLGQPVASDGRIFVPERANGVVHIVTPSRETFVSHPILGGGGDLRIRALDDIVVAYDATSPVAALLDRDGFVRFIDTSVDHRGISVVPGEEASAAVIDPEDPSTAADPATAESVSAVAGASEVDAATLATTLQNPVDAEEPLPSGDLVANFAFSATTVVVDEFVRFVDNSTGGPDSWSWDFGDGTGAEGPEVEKAWDTPGTFPVTLTVNRGEETAHISLAITVVPKEVALPPAADFQFSSAVVNVGAPIVFEDRSDGDIERWRWDFGDGASSTTANATKSWDTPGRYTVTLTVANTLGADSASAVIEVIANLRAPVAVLNVAATEVDLGAPLRFTARSTTDPATFTWDFGDGKTSSGAEVVHVFLKQGRFTVRLTAENDAGASTKTIVINVSPPTLPPKAIIGTLPLVIEKGDLVSLHSLSTNSPDSLEWVFGDGTSASGESVVHSWDREGSYVVALTATNSAGKDTKTVLIEILAELPRPIARVSEFSASPWVGDATVFVDGSVHATSWAWNFGDGTTSTARDPLHTFASAGQKVVTLTVTNRNGSNSASVVVEPRLRPTAGFVASSTAVRTGESVSFTDTSVNDVSWFWDFGDGQVSGNQNPSHAYAASGAYGVSLTIESATGDRDTFGPITITVDPASPLLSGITKVPVNAGNLTTLQADTFEAQVAASSGPIDRYRIDYGDGTTPAEGASPRFTHTYTVAGTYPVRMQARGPLPLGEWSPWVTRTITVVDPAPPLIAIADTVPNTAEVGAVALRGVKLNTSGPIGSWRWEITKGSERWVQSGQISSHTFTAAGAYTVTLIAESPVPAVPDAVVSRSITIVNPPPPNIEGLVANPTPATKGVVVTFTPSVTGSVSTWEWNYEGGGFVSGVRNGTHVFNTAGTHTIALRVTGPFGQQDVRTVQLVVNPQPAPSVPLASPSTPVLAGTTVNFSSTELNGRTGLTWQWQITNGVTPSSQTGQAITHNFATAGSWTVTVTATDALGISGSAVYFMTVENPVPPLIANFSHSVVGPLQIRFTDTSTGPTVVSWEWDFGTPAPVSGNTTAQNPLVTFAEPGSYLVTLRVRSANDEDPVTIRVTVA